MNPTNATYPTDAHLEAALADLRHRCRRRKRGRVVCTVEVLEGSVIGHLCHESDLTEWDIACVMKERPKKRGNHG